MKATVWLEGEPGELVSADIQPGPGAGVRIELCWRDQGLLRILLLEMDAMSAMDLLSKLTLEVSEALKTGGGFRE